MDYVSLQIGCDPHFEPPIAVRQRIQRNEPSSTIDVPLHDVAAQPVAYGGGALQIHERAFAQGSQVGTRQCFRRQVAPESVGLNVDRREANAVHGYAGAFLDVFENQAALDARAMARGQDSAYFFDDPCEH
jgi:hypothetical protein